MTKKVIQTDQETTHTRRSHSSVVHVTTLLDCPPERVWEEVQKPSLLQHVAAPLLRFEAVDPPTFPPRWREGKYLVRMKLLGVIPLGTQYIGIEIPPDHAPGVSYRLRDNGHGQLMNVWDHLITFEPTHDGKTRYTDLIKVNAGCLTPFARFFAGLFYRHRQRRWRRLVRRNFVHE